MKILLVLTMMLTACGPSAPVAPSLPQSVSPGWRLTSVEGTAPAWVATYTGPSSIHARIWAIPNSAVGLDRVQKWRPQADTVVFYTDRYFTAVDFVGLPQMQAAPVVRAIEQATRQ